MNKKGKKVLMALSGGIDSAVSCYLLLKQGYEVEAAFMKNWSSTAGLKVQDCPWLQDRQDALRVAAFLRVPLHTLDFEKQYAKTVMSYFFNEYKAGRTPNPDVMCNKEIKFKLLYNWAMKNGFDYVATGHYARVAKRPGISNFQFPISKKFTNSKALQNDGTYFLERSRDEFKDQTYFIYNIKQEQLPHILFPVGHLKKPQVKAMAKKIGLPNADKRESMGLCFVGKIRLKDFLEQKLKPKPGNIVLSHHGVMPASRRSAEASAEEDEPASRAKDIQSSRFRVKPGMTEAVKDKRLKINDIVLGEHHGLHNFTTGQRQGINVGGGGPYFVVSKDLKKNILYVTQDPNDPLLETKEVIVHSVNWITPPQTLTLTLSQRERGFLLPLEEGVRLRRTDEGLSERFGFLARYRHQGDLVACSIEKIDSKHYKVKFKTPQKALASGQSLVLYKGKVCVGGGVIG